MQIVSLKSGAKFLVARVIAAVDTQEEANNIMALQGGSFTAKAPTGKRRGRPPGTGLKKAQTGAKRGPKKKAQQQAPAVPQVTASQAGTAAPKKRGRKAAGKPSTSAADVAERAISAIS